MRNVLFLNAKVAYSVGAGRWFQIDKFTYFSWMLLAFPREDLYKLLWTYVRNREGVKL